jgi:hypothetical protein
MVWASSNLWEAFESLLELVVEFSLGSLANLLSSCEGLSEQKVL